MINEKYSGLILTILNSDFVSSKNRFEIYKYMEFYIYFLSKIYKEPKELSNKKIVDLGCGSVETSDMRGLKSYQWQPWLARMLNNIKDCEVLGVDKFSNSNEFFNFLVMDIFDYLKNKKNRDKIIYGEKVDLIINKDFTGFIGGSNRFKVSPSLFYYIKREYKLKTGFEVMDFMKKFKFILFEFVAKNLKDGGYYLVVSGKSYRYYKKECGILKKFKEGSRNVQD